MDDRSTGIDNEPILTRRHLERQAASVVCRQQVSLWNGTRVGDDDGVLVRQALIVELRGIFWWFAGELVQVEECIAGDVVCVAVELVSRGFDLSLGD